MMAAVTPFLSSETVTALLLKGKKLPPSSRRATSRFASCMFSHEQSWNPSPGTFGPARGCRSAAEGGRVYNGMFPCFLGGLLAVLLWGITHMCGAGGLVG